MERQEKSTNTEVCLNTSSISMVTEDDDEQLAEDMVHIPLINSDDTPKTSVSAVRRKRVATENICDPVLKKIKQEHQYVDPSKGSASKELLEKSTSKESVQKPPTRRYSTRGVKLDFAKLLGRNTESTGTKECKEEEVIKQDEAEEIVLVNENKERISLQVPKETAAKIREKIASIESNQNDISMETEEFNNSFEETDGEENLNENLDVSLTDDKTFNDLSVNSGSTEFFVRKYKLSNSATIPKVTFDLINPKARNGSYIVRKSYKVVDKYRCKKCDFTCETFIDCTDHMVEKHQTDSIFRCDVCERHFEKQSHLKLHLEIKHGPHLEAQHLQCKYCQKGYISTYALELHIESKHQNIKRPKFSCKHCSFIGQDRSDLESHVQDNHFHQHVGVMCKECGKTFLNSSRLGQHINAVHPEGKEFKCNVCHKTFATSRYLRVHMSTHSDVRNHECPICGRKFRKRGNMISHKETHKKKEDRTYRYMCSYCGQKVNSKTNLLEHMNKHTGDRPFLCEICGKSFAYRTGVSKHKIFCHSTHTPYRCDICEKTFKIKRLLKQHMTTHTGESRFKCDSCDKMLTTATTLKMHKRKCKGLQAGQRLTNSVILLSSQNIVLEASTGESSLHNSHFVEDVMYRGNNPVKPSDASVTTTVEMRSDVPSDLVQVQDAPSDLAIYICSECNSVFNDFSLAEQHILVDHEQASTANQIPPTESDMDPVHVILKDVTDAF